VVRSVSSLVAVYCPVWDMRARRPDCTMGRRRGDWGFWSAPGVVESRPSFFFSFSIQVEIAEGFGGYSNLTVESVSVSPWPTNDRSNRSRLQSFFLLLAARASLCLRHRRADLA
jgi:hypothetical protein